MFGQNHIIGNVNAAPGGKTSIHLDFEIDI